MENLIRLYDKPEDLVSQQLVQHWLGVVNMGLHQARGRVLGRRVVASLDRKLSGRRIGLRLYTDDPDEPHDFYTLSWVGAQVHLLARGKHAPEVSLKIGRGDMRDVLRRPEWYLRLPGRLLLVPMQRRLQQASQIFMETPPAGGDSAVDLPS